MSVKIKRGSDKSFVIKCRAPNGDPVDITDVTQATIKIPKKDNTKLSCNLDLVPAAFAKVVYSGITFTAMVAGAAGNLIILSFNGVLTVDAVVVAWNLANVGNEVAYSGLATQVPVAGTTQLANGLSAYNRVEKVAPYLLGKLKINLGNLDTADLKLAQSVAIDVILDEGESPEGTQRGFIIADALDII